jgi:hypothetical protein
MEKRYPYAFDTTEINAVKEAIQTRISLLQTFPPSAWRYSHLSVLNSMVERLSQLLEPVQDEEMIQIGRD